jgi:hypothetical protein
VGSNAAVLIRCFAVVLCCGTPACGGPARPELPAWRATWAQVRALVPDERDFGSGDPQPLCTALLAAIREDYAALVPAPDPSLDAAVEAWLERAEGLAFECPTGPDQRETRQAAFTDLAVLEAEIEAGLNEAGSG